MKKGTIVLVVMLFAGMVVGTGCKGRATVSQDAIEGTITISGAWALYPMVVRWGEEFQKIHPKVKVDVAAGGAGKGVADAIAGVVDLGMVSRAVAQAEVDKGAWWVSVTKDAVIPTVNEKNPVLAELLSKGLTRQAFVGIWIDGKIETWSSALGGLDSGNPIHVYTRSDACGAAQTWAEYLGGNQEDLRGVGVYGDPGLTEAVGKDMLGIGFNNVNYAYDAKSLQAIKGIKVLPLDFNGNRQIDPNEDFYQNRDVLMAAIAAGKYPSPPARDLHLVSGGKPKKAVVLEFLKWVLTDGQKYVPEAGYITLSKERIQSELKKLENK
jgi:phosphate transport system substrate-binding protein